MNLVVNGNDVEVKHAKNVGELLLELQMSQGHIVVAINLECVRHVDFERTILREGDRVEILSPHQGG